jgi:hypothetical protein
MDFSGRIFIQKYSISNIRAILPVSAALILGGDKKAGKRMDGSEEAIIRSSRQRECECKLKKRKWSMYV